MAAVPVTINGVAYPKNKKDKPFPVVIVGYAWATGLEPTHPIVYPPGTPPGSDVHPEHPIVLPPAVGDGPHPEHPIVLPPDGIPPEPPEIPVDPTMPKPPPPDGGWGWSPQYGWGYFPGSGGAQPKK